MTITKAYFNIVNTSTMPADTTMVLAGAALDGPVNTPFTIPVGADPYQVLGVSPLAKAYVQAYNTGASNIIVYRLNGIYAQATVLYKGQDLFRFRSVGASDQYNTLTDAGYNNIQAYIDGTMLKITTTAAVERIYLLKDYSTARDLADRLNLDAAYGLLEFETTCLQPNIYLSAIVDDDTYTAFFEGGSAETDLIPNRETATDISSTIAELKNRLKSALFGNNPDDQAAGDPNSSLGLIEYAGIALVDMFYDDDPEFATILGTFCYNRSFLGQGCLGVIGTKPIFDTTDMDSFIDSLTQLAPTSLYSFILDLNSPAIGEPIMPLNFVQIVVGDTLMSYGIGVVSKPVSLAYAYLGTQITYPYYVSMTNKTIAGMTRLNYEFEKEVVDKLLANGYISIVSSIRRRFVPYAATTAVGNMSRSSYKNPHHARIAQNISRLLVNNLDNLVGKTLSKATQYNLKKNVEDLVQTLVADGVIRAFSVSCEFVAPMYAEARVQVSFIPYSDVETVSSVTVIPYNKG